MNGSTGLEGDHGWQLGGDGADEKWREKADGAQSIHHQLLVGSWRSVVGSWRSVNLVILLGGLAKIEEAMARHRAVESKRMK